MDDWIKTEINNLQKIYGDVPPHWVVFPTEHPYSICWRMGTGEQHIMVWSAWWDSQNFSENQQIKYFQKWKPSPCWLGWIIEVIWDIDTWENINSSDSTLYFSRLENLGFGSKADYQKDLDDPKWLNQKY